jgi:MFS family permease
MSILIVGRAICGVGGVGLYISVMTLLSITTSIRKRPNYIALTGIVWGLGTVLSLVVRGAFADSTAT